MTLLKKRTPRRMEIDLSGPQGNAFFLLSLAADIAKKSYGRSETEINEMLNDMRSKDYRHMVETFDNHFGDTVDLILP